MLLCRHLQLLAPCNAMYLITYLCSLFAFHPLSGLEAFSSLAESGCRNAFTSAASFLLRLLLYSPFSSRIVKLCAHMFVHYASIFVFRFSVRQRIRGWQSLPPKLARL